MSANDRQVGGDHYKKGGEEHWDRAWRLKYDPFQYIITKWVERWKEKGGVQDLQKAHHAIEKYIELVDPTAQAPTPAMLPEGIQNCKVQERQFDFQSEVHAFNVTFGLPHPSAPQMFEREINSETPLERLLQFKKILQKELDEVDDIITKLEQPVYSPLDVLTDLADWLGDMQVYCASEMIGWGLPVNRVLECIMQAQWSKLYDGQAIIVDGKVQKGPDYQPPEPMIRNVLEARMTPVPEVTHTGTLDAHQDADWQCEGYYGDGTQLYRHRKSRLLTRQKSLQDAYNWHACMDDPQTGVS
jgi:hypothetical protein